MTISEIDEFLIRNGIISPPTPEEASEKATQAFSNQLKALKDRLDCLAMESMPEKEVDNILKADGIDPDHAVKEIKRIYSIALKKHRAELLLKDKTPWQMKEVKDGR